MIIFLKNGYQHTGMHRFLESMTILDNCQLKFVDHIFDTNDYPDEIGIYGGFFPKEVAFDAQSTKKKYYVYCSPLGQADLSGQHQYSPEICILLDLLEGIKLGYITNAITPSKSLNSVFEFIYISPFLLNPPKDIFCKERHNIGFMGNNLRKHKNVSNQIVAASKILRDYPNEKLIASDSFDYSHWARALGMQIERKQLKTDEEYFNEIASHRIGLQCSFSEAFNYIALEYAFVGVPVVVAPCIDWYPIKTIVNNIDSVDSIYTCIKQYLDYNNDHKDDIKYFLIGFAYGFNEENRKKLVVEAKKQGWIK